MPSWSIRRLGTLPASTTQPGLPSPGITHARPDLLSTVLDTPWILNVARISARLKRQLATATRRDQRINAMRSSDIELQRADLNYATRAARTTCIFCWRGRMWTSNRRPMAARPWLRG